MNNSKIRPLFKKALLFWIALIVCSLSFIVYSEYDHAEKVVISEAQTSIKKDLMFRKWVAMHGGVYVPVSERTPPNKYLDILPDRDIETPSGKKLTLMNPAYALSHMMKEYSELYGIKGHPTSKKLINPNNKADEWEDKQLGTIEKTKKPAYEIVDKNGEKYLRYINPMVTTQECLKCHAQQDYKVGDVRGAVSVSIPVKKHYEEAFEKSMIYALLHLGIFLIGILAIRIAYRQSQRWIKENSDYKKKLKEVNEDLEKKVQEGIRELRSRDDILMKQSKNAAMGEMIANIAHQWRQPLNSLGLIVQDLSEAKEYEELDQAYVDKIVKESMALIFRMSKTIDDFGNFFKPDKEAVEFLVSEVIYEVNDIIKGSLKNCGITLDIVDGKSAMIYGYKNEFSHVILNIISNAKDAFKESSTEDKRIIVAIEECPDEVILRIKDNAGGISEDIINRIFEPYFTTKSESDGTGIGLHMSKTIIEKNMQGKLSVRNIDDGAEFIIAVPRVNSVLK